MANEQQLMQIGRVAYRVEGDNWNVYYVPETDTMEGAVFFGSVRMALIAQKPERKAQFIAFMRDCFGDMIEQQFGFRPVWGDPIPGPEHERTKNG